MALYQTMFFKKKLKHILSTFSLRILLFLSSGTFIFEGMVEEKS